MRLTVLLLTLFLVISVNAKPKYVTCTIIGVFHGYEEAVIIRCPGDRGGMKTLISDLPFGVQPIVGTKLRVTRDKKHYAPKQPKRDDPCDDSLKPVKDQSKP